MLGEVLIKVVVTLLLCMSLVWTLLPWAFGLLNFQNKHGYPLYNIGRVCWWVMVAMHPVFAIGIWFFDASLSKLIFSLVAMHCFFGITFARNVSTQ
ncbi:hypothetical protein [Pseudoalteromonas sp. Of11M-6]|uniref:hypothetical protein n=1 Tax=Pseudoalteromonas sp. Of11M-6 TaxID=2917754 RepID=UPI001EF45C0F|nr:hypothetical protein [Pseudoalteromonas sp. Of11M-6]MCG7554411.1 hypothetical protein [Pseudoalteromonas sp. Of11M-6]